MQIPSIFRKRLIPDEIIPLKKDRVLYLDDAILVTDWSTIRPRNDFASGSSCYFFKEGLKISRFYDHEHRFLRWYCDIIDTQYDASSNTYIFTDLLADVEIYPDGSFKILDLDELAQAHASGLLSDALLEKSLLQLHYLLELIYTGQFLSFADVLLQKEKTAKDI